MSRLRHGYTNQTRRLPGGSIEKRYEGTLARERARAEYNCLRGLSGVLPVPSVIDYDRSAPRLVVAEMPGRHGQDLMEAGRASEVMRLLGALLARLQEIDPVSVDGLTGSGAVIVHGDFGPQNMLVHAGRISALVDWEFAHVGQRVEDIAWAEWIVRMHHPEHLDAVPDLFDAASVEFSWAARHEAMVTKCEALLRLVEAGKASAASELWRARTRVTDQWTE